MKAPPNIRLPLEGLVQMVDLPHGRQMSLRWLPHSQRVEINIYDSRMTIIPITGHVFQMAVE